MPLAELTDIFGLIQGERVVAKSRARNELGWAYFSDLSTSQILVVVKPHMPALPPIRDSSASSLTSLNIMMPFVSGVQAGGLPILSYSLEYSLNQITWTSLVGFSSPYPLTAYSWTGLNTKDDYYFRYLVRNEVGWSDPSAATLTYVGTEPAQMVAPSTTIGVNPTKVLISWQVLTSSIDGGLPLNSYKIEILTSVSSFTEAPGCYGSDPLVMSSLSCDVALLSLLVAPFSLRQGAKIQARVTAINSIGPSTPSAVNS